MRWLIAQIFGNFGVVEKGRVYRSAQRWYMYPIWLCLGLKTRINLATSENDLQDRFEKWLWNKLGVKYITFPSISPDIYFKEAYKALVNAEKPVLVGCEGGRDRAGGLVGLYKRIDLQKTYTEIVEDWPIYGTPGEDWLIWFFMYLESF